ncbi:MAG: AmmeMemoRadiSam system protein B, partial [Candidatus Krumholzibacteria bacterium]|nr:AmmeMemoRadiSam system protein B [Candidatus Krumholzibacteria bacterium]
MTLEAHTRRPAVAGLFYPAEPSRLAEQVDALIDTAPDPAPGGRLAVMVSPHAGYPYSGAVAARGFRRLQHEDLETLVLVGPSHVEYFDFSAVFAGRAYETPLGPVAVDTDLAQRLAGSRPSLRASARGHVQAHLGRGEHSLEVQLPFLQRTFPHARVVPIVMGEQRWENCLELGEALAEHCGQGTVILASTDLSHFYDHDRATVLDSAFCDALSGLDARALHNAVREGRCEACGAGPVVASLV